ncbi:MAG: hypothetical protein HQL08_07940 [Nitrospirae bacterium]|nr:hypothetical protein [Nitrospirota bacterium]
MTNNLSTGGRIKIAAFYCLAAGLVFTIILSAVILSGKYRDSLAIAVDTLQKARLNLMQVRDANRLVDSSLSGIKAIVPPGVFSIQPEVALLERIDDMKERAKDAEITVSNIDRKGDEVSLPVTMRSGVRDYTDLVNTVGYLESMRFPFFSITNVSITPSQDKLQYDIRGALRMPKR